MGFEERATAPVMSRRTIITLDLPGGVPSICRLRPTDPVTAERFVVRRELAPAHCGVPMMLRVRVLDAVDRPLPGAVLEIIHRGPLPTAPELSGAQVTDPHGYAEFKTVYPGWASDRPAGIDLVLYLAGSCDRGRLHFPAPVTAQVARLTAYRENPDPLPPPEPPAGFPNIVPRDRYDLAAGLLASINAVTDR
ncbi:hypothetical protein ACWT_5072 [Actinoplanes sp. SE50]|uniref:hypothetical protein n=1 Tax=unclassified Actinoplanes TaxID=2626549 RepID=UPI00023ED0D3|nr:MULTISPECIES: hypothetical protein [unclassified Actinoplanes]AEV86089.1 hypothetical protein ACPL_5202 [Actinoplanes sp. SE50/110]ATO84487.1 hypothetical protein ACWT_5072 [Actinoplanes sp. SE50]SLM01897.1 hypothetical protein ACSP50_5135 [Actinoplanes sp. SE50/110]